MGYLLVVTLIQAFSFSLIGEYLAGHVDSYFAVLVRVLLAGLVFIPLTRWRSVQPTFMRGMLVIGALQFGVTYVCLYLSFRVLTVPEVLLFTILTPLHVTLIEDALNRRFNPWALLAALVAVLGAGIIRYDGISSGFLLGFLLLQVANFTFAAGQVLYKHLLLKHPSTEPQYKRFGFFYLGALLIALPAFLLLGNSERLPSSMLQWSVLVWLGVVASGLGLYWWNKGASLVDGGTLATSQMLAGSGLYVNHDLESDDLGWSIGANWQFNDSMGVFGRWTSAFRLPSLGNYITRKGDTVEKILQKFYPASPLRADVLRDALLQNNPTAFPKGSAKSLVIGSNLSLPDPLELSRKLLMPAMAPVAPPTFLPTSRVVIRVEPH